ncbi:MAG: DNA primase [Dehalococcoidales bacterium]|nr:DNA primase [Dehalococcoidales bacterium]
MGIIDEIKQKTDIVEIIGQYVQLTRSGRALRAPCPFHSEKKPSFFVYPEQQTWHCFGACNTGGDVFSFIMKKEGLDFGDALRFLAEKSGVVIPSPAKAEAEDKARENVISTNLAASQYFHHLLINTRAGQRALDYLRGRGLTDNSIASFQLGYSLPGWESLKSYLSEKGLGENDLLEAGLIIRSEDAERTYDRFRDHVMFPIMDDRGRVVGFGARVLEPASDKQPKYINSPQTKVFDKSGCLYGIHLAKSAIRQENQAVLVEGYMDVIAAHQYGISNVIAPMGVAITERQINQIKKLTRNIALALDPDTAGEEAAMRCVEYENSLDTEVKVISLPDGKDPDEVIKADPESWKSLVGKAVPVIDYTISFVTSKLDMKSTRGKTEAVNRLLPLVAGVKAGMRQEHYLTKLALAIAIDVQKLEAMLGRVRPDRKARETKSQAVQKATRSLSSNPLEEYALAILIQRPEIKTGSVDLLAEYFENSENRIIFEKWQKTDDPAGIKESLDPLIREHVDNLSCRNLPGDDIESRYTDCVLRLRERFLRGLKRRQEETLALEAESGNRDSVLARLQEDGTHVEEELKKIFDMRAKAGKEEKNERP